MFRQTNIKDDKSPRFLKTLQSMKESAENEGSDRSISPKTVRSTADFRLDSDRLM